MCSSRRRPKPHRGPSAAQSRKSEVDRIDDRKSHIREAAVEGTVRSVRVRRSAEQPTRHALTVRLAGIITSRLTSSCLCDHHALSRQSRSASRPAGRATIATERGRRTVQVEGAFICVTLHPAARARPAQVPAGLPEVWWIGLVVWQCWRDAAIRRSIVWRNCGPQGIARPLPLPAVVPRAVPLHRTS